MQSHPQQPNRHPDGLQVGGRARRLDLALVALVFCGALALRLVDLTNSGPVDDEARSWSASQRLLSDLRAGRMAPERWSVAGRPILPQLLYAPATQLSSGLQSARSLSAVLGALLCVVVFFAGRDLLGRGEGLAAAVFCLSSPPLIAASRSVGPAAPAALFYALAVWLFFRALVRGDNARAYLAAGACAGLACAAQLASFTLVVILSGLFLAASWSQLHRERSLRLPLNLIVAPLLALALLVGLWPALWASPLQQLTSGLGQLAQSGAATHGAAGSPKALPLALILASSLPLLMSAALFLPQPLWQRDLGRLGVLLWLLGPLAVSLLPAASSSPLALAPSLVAVSLAAAAGLGGLSRVLSRLLHRPALQAPVFAFMTVGAAFVSLQGAIAVNPT